MSQTLWRQRPFVAFWLSQNLSFVAYQMLSVALGWQMYLLTGKVLDLGLIGLVQFLPQLLLMLVVGHVADRYPRQPIVAVCLLAQALVVALLALASAQQQADRNLLLSCALLLGVARAFQAPSMQAMLPALVGTSALPAAVALMAGARELAVVAGPALGGVLLLSGLPLTYTTCLIFYLLAGLALSGFRVAHTPSSSAPVRWQDMLQGVHFIRSHPVLLGAVSLDMMAVLLGGATALLPVYAHDILKVDAWGLGLLRAAPAVGAVAMSVWLARHPLRQQVGRYLFVSVAVYGLATLGFGLSTSFSLSLLALLILGAADMISVVIRSALVQLETPDHMRGRVGAVNFVFIGASNQLGEFESGASAAWLGVVPAVVAGGIGTLLVVVCWQRWFPDLARRQHLSP